MNIRELRVGKNMTQTELAKCVGVGQTAVANWESGVAKPKTNMLPALAAALGCTIDELYGKEG